MPVGGAISLPANRAPMSAAAGCWVNLLLERRLATHLSERGDTTDVCEQVRQDYKIAL